MFGVGRGREMVLSLKVATMLARVLFCALALFGFLVVGTVVQRLIAGGSASLMTWIAQVSGSGSDSGFATFVLFSEIMALATFAVWRLQTWLNRKTVTTIIVEDITSRVAANQPHLAEELRAQLSANLATLPNRTLLGLLEAKMPICRSEEHTSELQSLRHLVCRLLL